MIWLDLQSTFTIIETTSSTGGSIRELSNQRFELTSPQFGSPQVAISASCDIRELYDHRMWSPRVMLKISGDAGEGSFGHV